MVTNKIFVSLILVTYIQISVSQLTFPPDPKTQRPIAARVVQNYYMKPVVDDLPALETITDCKCPRVYIPICGTDHKSYTNICKMNCANYKRRLKEHWSEVLYVGVCQEFFEFVYPYDTLMSQYVTEMNILGMFTKPQNIPANVMAKQSNSLLNWFLKGHPGYHK